VWHANERRVHLDSALAVRAELFDGRKQLIAAQTRHVEMVRELDEQNGSSLDLEADFQAASDHLGLVQAAVRQQEKIDRYQTDIEEITYRLEEQSEVVEQALEQQSELEAKVEAAELEVDEIKSQLADYQQALDVQQTSAIQYQKAQQALERAKKICQLPKLTPDNVEQFLTSFEQK